MAKYGKLDDEKATSMAHSYRINRDKGIVDKIIRRISEIKNELISLKQQLWELTGDEEK